ncbi:hypothetical protein F442_16713 [Phytophthora nicotianae P10297]|uniref:Uncharacterized protein n=1 Tax=Phytophthora nicotianae P10297 TaxID=1317064 RepID=W2YJR1_PHYNI|nr:hypothetical protein F442_16713 [Phytophthora nicotianae P10297]
MGYLSGNAMIKVTDLGGRRACRSEGRSHHSEKKTGAKTT